MNIPLFRNYLFSSIPCLRILINNNVIKPFLLDLSSLEWLMQSEDIRNEIFNNNITSTIIVEDLDILRNFINNDTWLSYLVSNETIIVAQTAGALAERWACRIGQRELEFV